MMKRSFVGLPVAALVVSVAIPSGIAQPNADNLVTNSTFDGSMSPWWAHQAEGAEATSSVRDGELCTTITSPGANPWDVVVGLNGLSMSAGTHYRIVFQAHADTERALRVKTGLGDAPYTDYFVHEVSITAEPSRYEVTFLNPVEDPSTQLQFHFGDAGAGTICVDDVVVQRTAAPDLSGYATPSTTGHPLRGYAGTVLMGTAVDTPIFLSSPEHNALVAAEFNLFTPANAMKMEPLVPVQGQYQWSVADAMVDFAETHGMKFHGHALVWHVQQPTWIEEANLDRDGMIAEMYQHIDTVMGRYQGRIQYWDVVNEAIHHFEGEAAGDGGPDAFYDYRESIWYERIGEDYIQLAFERARQADPTAKLLYNDFNHAPAGHNKSDRVYEMVKGLVEAGTPIDMVGLQMHLIADQPPDAASVRANMDRYAELGLGVQITEIDVRVREPATAADLEAQAEIYADMLQVCIDAPNCRHFTTWGASDVDSWIPGWFEGYGSAHLFDEQLEAKPAYHALTDVLAAYPVTPTGSGGAGGAEPVGAAGAGTGAVPSAAPVARDDDGCQCRVDTADPTRPSAWWAVVALALAAFWRRRR